MVDKVAEGATRNSRTMTLVGVGVGGDGDIDPAGASRDLQSASLTWTEYDFPPPPAAISQGGGSYGEECWAQVTLCSTLMRQENCIGQVRNSWRSLFLRTAGRSRGRYGRRIEEACEWRSLLARWARTSGRSGHVMRQGR